MDAAMFKAQKNASSCTVRYWAQHCWYYFSKHVAYCLFQLFICLITYPTYTTIGITEPLTHSVYIPQQHWGWSRNETEYTSRGFRPVLRSVNWRTETRREAAALATMTTTTPVWTSQSTRGNKITTLKMWHEETNSGKNLVDWSPCFHLYPEGNVVCTHSTYNCFTQMF
jgi:hypothetical protein